MTLPAIHFKPHTHPDRRVCYTTDCELRSASDVQQYDRYKGRNRMEQWSIHIKKNQEFGEFEVTFKDAAGHIDEGMTYFSPDEDDAVYTALSEGERAKQRGARVYFTQGALNRIRKYEPGFEGYGRLG